MVYEDATAGEGEVTVTCEKRMRIGGGAAVHSERNQHQLVKSYPIDNGWAAQSNGTESERTVVYVLCAVSS